MPQPTRRILKSDRLLAEAYPLLAHLIVHLSGEAAIETADDLLDRMAAHLTDLGLMRRAKGGA